MQKPLAIMLFWAVAALLLYAALVQAMPLRVAVGQNQDATNMIRVQDYLVAPDPAVVLTGSSLTFRLPQAQLGREIVNLALAGGGARTGLDLIAASGAKPGLVLIETNLLLRPPDKAMIASQMRFPDRQLHRVRALRAGYDPVNLLWRGMHILLHRSDGEAPLSAATTQQLLSFQRREKMRSPDAQALKAALSDTMRAIVLLRRRGVAVGLYEMPIDQSLTDSPFDTALRRAVEAAFPPGHFCWLRVAVPGGPRTIDGIHLAPADAAQVAHSLTVQAGHCR